MILGKIKMLLLLVLQTWKMLLIQHYYVQAVLIWPLMFLIHQKKAEKKFWIIISQKEPFEWTFDFSRDNPSHN